MKRITLRNSGTNQSIPTFRLIMEHSPQKPLSVPEIRARVKVLDALEEASGNTLVLEDAEHATLKAAMESFPWQQASRDLLVLIDDVIEAPPVSSAQLHSVDPDDDSRLPNRVQAAE